MLAKIHVTYRKEVLDPQGKAINEGLKSLGFNMVQDVRMGKYFEIKLDKKIIKNKSDAESAIEDMSRKLLANPVIEDYSFELIDK